MTEVEVIILQHFARNPFMYDNNQNQGTNGSKIFEFYDKLRDAIFHKLQINLSIFDIEKTWLDMKNSFERIDLKLKLGEKIIFSEEKVYKKLYFLKPFVQNQVINKKNKVETKANEMNSTGENEKNKLAYKQLKEIKIEHKPTHINYNCNKLQLQCFKILNKQLKSLSNGQQERLGLLRMLNAFKQFKLTMLSGITCP